MTAVVNQNQKVNRNVETKCIQQHVKNIEIKSDTQYVKNEDRIGEKKIYWTTRKA